MLFGLSQYPRMSLSLELDLYIETYKQKLYHLSGKVQNSIFLVTELVTYQIFTLLHIQA